MTLVSVLLYWVISLLTLFSFIVSCVFAVRCRAAADAATPGGLHVFCSRNPGGAVCRAHTHTEIVRNVPVVLFRLIHTNVYLSNQSPFTKSTAVVSVLMNLIINPHLVFVDLPLSVAVHDQMWPTLISTCCVYRAIHFFYGLWWKRNLFPNLFGP